MKICCQPFKIPTHVICKQSIQIPACIVHHQSILTDKISMCACYRDIIYRVTSFQLFDGSQGLVSVFSSYLIAAFEISGSYPIPICMQKRVAGRNFNDFILVKCQFPNVIGNVGKDKGIIFLFVYQNVEKDFVIKLLYRNVCHFIICHSVQNAE
jgi:hypothetical protein